MATSVLSNSSSQFAAGAEAYSSNMYSSFPNYEGFPSESQPPYMYNPDSAPMSYSSTDSWANQANALRRVSSRSPSIQHDRTPIRHHKPNVTRSRSTSKSEALLAYATEQSVQSAQHSTSTTPSLPQTTPSSSPGLFHTQSYTSPSMATSYSQHAAYYDNQSPHFHDMHNPPSNQSHSMSDYITANRAEMQIPSMLGTGLSAHETMYLQGQQQSRNAALGGLPPAPLGFPPLSRPLESTPGGIEVSSSRNKPQCWEHGCNGRQFSTFSNLLRHQREKSGTAAKAKCPHCGTEFTRTTARNGHMYGGKCKGMPDSGQRSPSTGEGQSDTEGQR